MNFRKMQNRVVHILYSYGIGGMEKGVSILINNASLHIEHVIVCLNRAGESRNLLSKDIPIYELNKAPGHSFSFIRKLSKLLKRLNPNVVHCRNWGGTDGVIAARMAGIRSIVQGEHGWDIDDQDGNNLKRVLYRRAISILVAEYSCVSAHMKTWLQETVKVTKKVNHIYNGIDTNTFRPRTPDEKLKKKIGLSENDLIIGSIGRLDPIKNYPLLIKSFKTISMKYPQARLVIVGNGPESGSLQAMADDRVTFLGMRSDVAQLMQLFHVYVLTSNNEGISNTILEAMACGKPIIATNVGGNPELVVNGKNGFIIDRNDEEELCRRIITYFENEELRLIHGKNARKYVVERFSIEKMVKDYEKLYEKVAYRY